MSNCNNTSEIIIGQRLFCALYGGQHGIVFDIEIDHFNQPRYDVVFSGGEISKGVSIHAITGIQWRILPGIADAEEIATALTFATLKQANARARAEQALQRDIESKDLLKASPHWSHLTQGDDEHSGRLAAKNIRAELKKAFPRVKFSVRVGPAGSVCVRWMDGPTLSAVEKISQKYRCGNFDGQDDLYRYNTRPWHSIFGGALYVREYRSYTDSLTQSAIDLLFERYPSNLKGIDKPSADDYHKGRTYYIDVPGFNESLQRLIGQQLKDM